jgi:hypothetical protein
MIFLLPTRTIRAVITIAWSVPIVKPRAIVGGTGTSVVVVLKMAEEATAMVCQIRNIVLSY